MTGPCPPLQGVSRGELKVLVLKGLALVYSSNKSFNLSADISAKLSFLGAWQKLS